MDVIQPNERELFDQAVELDPGGRRSFLDDRCTSPEMRARIEKLLSAHDRETDLGLVPSQIPGIEGSRVGPYRIIELLGEGGMGSVYAAEQTDPVRREVALKLVRGGANSEEILQRFGIEQQALARMEHPNIAAMFDGGRTESGEPYFVMELVRGETITRHCERNALSVEERMRLMIDVCSGVEHAHQKGVLHRDIKPSNVLVSEVDGEAVPKVIDFGVAKAVDQPLTEETFGTELGRAVGTPAYMSPEQADLGDSGVDTRSDVYSLGALLYELLTGAVPLDFDLFAGWLALTRRLAEDRPLAPSRKVREDEATSSVTAASCGFRGPEEMSRRLRGELDWITLKALDKDPERRYSSPNELANDLRRFLANEPIEARPPSVGYLTRKFVVRHKWGVALGSALVAALVVGLVGTAMGFVAAEADAQRARSTADFFQTVLGGVNPAIAQGADTTLFRQILDDTSERIGTELDGRPLVAASIHTSMATAYNSISEYSSSLEQARSARRLLTQELGEDDPKTIEASLRVAQAQVALGQESEALAALDSVMRRIERTSGLDSEPAIVGRHHLGMLHLSAGRYAEALEEFQAELAFYRSLGDEDSEDLLTAINSVGVTYLYAGEVDLAEPLLEESLTRRRRLHGEDHPETLNAIQNLAGLRRRQQRFEETEQLYRDSLNRLIEINGERHAKTLIARDNLAHFLSTRGASAEAVELIREAHGIRIENYGEQDPRTFRSARKLSFSLRRSRFFQEAEEYGEAALFGLRELYGPDDQNAIGAAANLAEVRWDLPGKAESAEALHLDAIERYTRIEGEESESRAVTMSALGWRYKRAGRVDEGLVLLEEAHGVQAQVLGEVHSETLMTLVKIGRLLHDAERVDESIPVYADFLAGWFELFGVDAWTESVVGRMLTDLGKVSAHAPHDESLRMLQTYVEGARPAEDPQRRAVAVHLAQACVELGREEEARTLLGSIAAVEGETDERSPHWLAVAAPLGLVSWDAAADSLRRAWEDESLEPADRRFAARGMTAFHESQGSPEEAELWRARALEIFGD